MASWKPKHVADVCFWLHSYNKTNQMHQFLKFIFGIKLYMFRTVSLSIVSWQLARKLSANLYDIYHCCVYSEKPLMMDRGTVRNM